jgi:hypothetical protein
MAIVPAATRINDLLSAYALATTPLSQFAKTEAVSWGGDNTLSHALGAGAVTATLTTTGSLAIDVLNDADDRDRENIVGKPAADARSGIDWVPQLQPDGKVRLGYHISMALKAGLTAKLAAAATMSATAQRAFVFSAYRVHGPERLFGEAIRADLSGLPSILSLEECQGLQVGEALAMRVGGSAAISLSVSMAEVFASSVGSLTTALGTKQILALNFQAGLKLDAKLSFEDELQVAISRRTDGFRVALRKVEQRSASLGLKFDITVELSEASRTALLGVADQILDQINDRASQILAQLQQMQPAQLVEQAILRLPEVLKPFAEQLGQNLGLPQSAPVDDWIKALEARRKDIHEKIIELAESQLKFSFNFNYQRVTSEGTILECDFPALNDQLHQHLLRYDFDAILTNLGQWGGTLRHFLHQETYERVSTIGFSLGIGKWFNAESATLRRRLLIKQTNAAKQSKIATIGEYHYTGKFQKDTRSWRATLKGDMENFQSEPPSMKDISLGLSIAYEIQEEIWGANEIEQLLDTAEAFNVFDSVGRSQALAQIMRQPLKNAKASVLLSVTGEMLRVALIRLSRQSSKHWGKALAAAMGKYRNNGKLVVGERESLESRIHYYSAGWAALTQEQPSLTKDFWRQSLKKTGLPLKNYQREAPKDMTSIGSLNPATATRMAYNLALPERFSKYAAALKSLTTATDGNAEQALTSAQQGLMLKDTVFDDAFTTRAIAYLLSRACERADSPDATQYQATLTLQTANDGPALVFAQR